MFSTRMYNEILRTEVNLVFWQEDSINMSNERGSKKYVCTFHFVTNNYTTEVILFSRQFTTVVS